MSFASQFRLSSIQSVIFTPSVGVSSSRLLAHLLDRWGDRFDGQPLTMPLPADVPPEIPSIVLTNNDKSLTMQISKTRTSVIWARTTMEVAPDIRATMQESFEVLQDFVEYVRTEPGRLAGILSRFVPTENPAKMLAEHFCKDVWLTGPLGRPESFEIHALKKFTLAERFNVNSWFRVRTGIVIADQRTAVLVEQDINTFAEEQETQQFGKQNMQDFFNIIPSEFDHILKLYFP